MSSTSTYEAWVHGLRRWALDPTADLGGLPALTVDSFTPDTYRRLLGHLHTAIATMMRTWQAQLTRDLGSALDDHGRARALVSLRVLLARRLELAKHPALPREVSHALWDSAARDIEHIQRTLETEVVRPRDGTARADGAQERLLQLVKQHSFVVLIQPGFPLSAFIAQQGITSASTSPDVPRVIGGGPPPEFTERAPRRRVLLD